ASNGNEDNVTQTLYRVGTAANIFRFVSDGQGQHHLVCQGISRFCVDEFVEDESGPLSAKVSWIDEPRVEGDKRVEARMTNLRNRVLEAIQLMDQAPQGLVNAIRSIDSASLVADAIAGHLGLKPMERQKILETTEIESRLELVQSF